VLRIVAAMRRLALPFLAVRSADIDVDVRFWATYLLGELNYEDSASALLPRLFDENPVVRRIAVRSARSLVAAGAEGTPIRKNLERTVTYADEPLMRRLTALSTIGELKLYKSIPALIEVLADKNASIVEGSVRALVAMTRQEFGKDAKKWRDWWETKGKKLLS
jgi:HEAT repeat protein